MRFMTLFFMLTVLVYKVEAVDYHVCDCEPGAATDCVAGDDTFDGSMQSPWRSFEKATMEFANLNAGDAIRFCNGGRWQIPNAHANRWVNFNCQASLRCVISNYAPLWNPSVLQRPVLYSNNETVFWLADSGNASHEEGYHFANLDLRNIGPQTDQDQSRGIFLANDIDDVSIDNMNIDGFDIGVFLGGSNACEATDTSCDGQNKRISLSNSVISNSHSFGWLGASSGTLLSNNEFHHNGTLQFYDHHIYLSNSAGEVTSGIQVVGNYMYKSALDENGWCGAAPLVVHGQHDNLLIESNTVIEDIGLTHRRCWGIIVDNSDGSESFHDLIIRGNLIKNVGNNAIAVGGCSSCTIENNVIVNQQTGFNYWGIQLPTRGEHDFLDNITIRNNSIYIDGGQNANGITLNHNGSNHSIVNNSIHYVGNNGLFNCFDSNLNANDFYLFDNNNCHRPNASGSEWVDGMGSLENWQNITGFDMLSSQTDPLFTNPTMGLMLPANNLSPLVNRGNELMASVHDFMGLLRDDSPDVGAFEWFADDDLIFGDGFDN